MTDSIRKYLFAGVQSNLRDSNVVKSTGSVGQVGSKLRRKAYRSRGEIDNNAAINSVQCRTSVRKRRGAPSATGHKLYAFPSFDRSDALLFLPTTMISLLNAYDISGVSKLLQSHLDKNCAVEVSHLSNEVVSVHALIQFHSLLTDLHPDSLTCVHTTKVVDNQIRASIYTKFTANKTIYDSVARMSKDPLFVPMFGLQREASIKRNLDIEKKTEHEKNQFIEIANTDADLLVYMHIEMVLTINDFTKKVTRYGCTARITSIEPINDTIEEIL